jgi:hypothetical protein
MTQKIVQIVPRLPPETDGVGDYSLMLAQQLRQDYQIETHFLVFQPPIQKTTMIDGFLVTNIPNPDSESLASVLPTDINNIILQYSNYPYLKGKLDAPFWLARGLELSCQQRQLNLITMFHELPTLKWKKIRLLNPLQYYLSLRLAKISHQLITNNSQFQKILQQGLKRPVSCLPNFSTIGEPQLVTPLSQRKNQLVIFGSTNRGRVYQNSLPKLLKFCHQFGINTIYDVGRPLNLKDNYDFGSLNLQEMGFQPAEIVSKVLLDSKICCFDYTRFPKNLAKSTVFAAAAAHGLVPLSTEDNDSEADGLENQQHYLVLEQQLKEGKTDQWPTIADNAYKWYSEHNLRKNSQVFASYLFPLSNNNRRSQM